MRGGAGTTNNESGYEEILPEGAVLERKEATAEIAAAEAKIAAEEAERAAEIDAEYESTRLLNALLGENFSNNIEKLVEGETNSDSEVSHKEEAIIEFVLNSLNEGIHPREIKAALKTSEMVLSPDLRTEVEREESVVVIQNTEQGIREQIIKTDNLSAEEKKSAEKREIQLITNIRKAIQQEINNMEENDNSVQGYEVEPRSQSPPGLTTGPRSQSPPGRRPRPPTGKKTSTKKISRASTVGPHKY